MSELEVKKVESPFLLASFVKLASELRDAIAHSGNYTTPSQVWEAVVSGSSFLLVGQYKGEYAGFATAEVLEFPEGRCLNFPFAHTNPRLRGTIDVMAEFLAMMEDVARGLGCVKVLLTSTRPAYRRHVKRFGYEPDIVRYSKAVV